MRASRFLAPVLLSGLLAGVMSCQPAAQAQDFTTTVKTLVEGSPATQLAVPGAASGWYFLRKELEHLAQGDLGAADMTKANKEGADPVPVIAKYAAELKALGVDLLLVPVPAKAAIYPDKLTTKIDASTIPSMAGLYAKLKDAGVNVLDLESLFKEDAKKNAADPTKQLYCATDSHWSPYACEMVAKIVADRYKGLKEISEASLADLIALPTETLEFHGDLLTDAEKSSVPKEKLPFVRAGLAVPPDGKQVTTLESDPTSAMLVMGDSHLQVFRKGGNMLATQGGFINHLQVFLPTAVEEVTMQAGGADGPRVEIARATAKNPDYWNGKKVVVWVFTAREFTQGKWRVIPAKVIKK